MSKIIVVAQDGKSYKDGFTCSEAHSSSTNNLLNLVFMNGEMIKEYTLDEVRTNMYPEGF